jgi:hypothetical protein
VDFLTLELLSNKNWVSLVFTVILTIRLPTWYLSFRNETAFHLICHSTWMRTTKQTDCFLYANMHIHRYISKKSTFIYFKTLKPPPLPGLPGDCGIQHEREIWISGARVVRFHHCLGSVALFRPWWRGTLWGTPSRGPRDPVPQVDRRTSENQWTEKSEDLGPIGPIGVRKFQRWVYLSFEV